MDNLSSDIFRFTFTMRMKFYQNLWQVVGNFLKFSRKSKEIYLKSTDFASLSMKDTNVIITS